MDKLDLALNDLTRLMQNHQLLTRRWMEMIDADFGVLSQGEIAVAQVGRPVWGVRQLSGAFSRANNLPLPEAWVRLIERFNGMSAGPRKHDAHGINGLQVVSASELSEPFLWPVHEATMTYLDARLMGREELSFVLGGFADKGMFLLKLGDETENDAVSRPVHWFWYPGEERAFRQTIPIANDLAEWLWLLYQSALYIPELIRRIGLPSWAK
jgi:hypothetical protein